MRLFNGSLRTSKQANTNTHTHTHQTTKNLSDKHVCNEANKTKTNGLTNTFSHTNTQYSQPFRQKSPAIQSGIWSIYGFGVVNVGKCYSS